LADVESVSAGRCDLSKKLNRSDRVSAAFTDMVNEHWNAVYRLLHSLAGNVHDTDDLAQETFLRAMGRFDSFQKGTNLRSWLLRIASNAFFDEQRKRKRSKAASLEEEPPARVETPGQALELAQQSALVKTAMQDLSELTRMVFHLRATEDLSFREIAEIAGTTEQAARWHMHHARTTLLENLGDDF
jgi:RNA polymerase sigma-70 factor (ECF subfamily)